MQIGIYSFFREGMSLCSYLSPHKKIKETTTKYEYLIYLDNGIPCLHFTEKFGINIELDICEVPDNKIQKWAKTFGLIPYQILTKDNEKVVVYFKNNNNLNLSLNNKGISQDGK